MENDFLKNLSSAQVCNLLLKYELFFFLNNFAVFLIFQDRILDEFLKNVQVREIVDVMEEKRVHKGSFVIREGWYRSFNYNSINPIEKLPSRHFTNSFHGSEVLD